MGGKTAATAILPAVAAGIFCLLAFGRAHAMSQPPTYALKIENRCSHPVEARAKQRITRPWRNVPRRFSLEPGERLEDSRQLAGLFGIGPREAPPPEVSFSYRGEAVPSASIRRFGGMFTSFTIIACTDKMTDEEKMTEEEWIRRRNEQMKRDMHIFRAADADSET